MPGRRRAGHRRIVDEGEGLVLLGQIGEAAQLEGGAVELAVQGTGPSAVS